MDVITIPRLDQHFRLLYDTKGRFVLVPIKNTEASFKLCRVQKSAIGRGGISYINTHDGRTIRFPDPDIASGDSVKVKLSDNTISDFYKLDIGARVMVVKGRNTGRIQNVFVIGTDDHSVVSVPKGAGVKISIIEEKAR